MKLALGTVQFGLPYGIANQAGQVSRDEAGAILDYAWAQGIDTLDTAIAYGESEQRLGEIGVGQWKLISKLPALPESCKDVTAWVQEQVASSLSRLGVNELYGLLLHSSEQLLGKDGKALYQALQGLKEAGQVQKVGVSIYTPNELEPITKLFRLDLVQAPFNLVDRRLHTSGWLQRLKHAGVEIHTRSAFLQGLLLMPRADIPAKFVPWTELWDKWHNWLACHSATAVHACLAYPLSFPEIDRVVIGTDSKNQLEQIIGAALGGVPDDLPDLRCEDENLINPAYWSRL